MKLDMLTALAATPLVLIIALTVYDLAVTAVRRRLQRQRIKRLVRSHLQSALDGDESAIRQVTECSLWLRQRGL